VSLGIGGGVTSDPSDIFAAAARSTSPVAARPPPTPYLVPGIVATGDTDPESDDEAFVRKRTQAKSFTLPRVPTGGGFRNWVSEAYSLMEAASNRRRERTRRFVQAVETCSDPELLLSAPRRWESFDSELLVAVLAVAPAELNRTLVNKREALQRKGAFLTGRYALWSFYSLFRIERADSLQIDLKTLWSYEYGGDLALYIAGLDAILLNFTTPPDPDMVAAAVIPQLRRCKHLSAEFSRYDAADEGHADHTLQYMYESAKRWVDRKRREDVTAQMIKPAKVAVAKGGGKTTPICPFYFKYGKCNQGSRCTMAHVAKDGTANVDAARGKGDGGSAPTKNFPTKAKRR